MTEPYDFILEFRAAQDAATQATKDAVFHGWGGSGTATTTDVQTTIADYQTRITALEGPVTLTQYTTSATWTNPTPAAHNLITVICINGGDGGGKAAASQGLPGGQSGGYFSQQLYTDAITSTVAMTIGAGGAGATTAGAAGSAGGTTSFGSYVTGQKGVGGVFKADGTHATSIPPGAGGRGFMIGANTVAWPSERGQSGPFAAGGEAGTTGNGAAGQAAPAGVPSGGGGGGGGGNAAAGSAVGGAGGFPGGGGGAGGTSSSTGVASNGGAGAAGCIYVIT